MLGFFEKILLIAQQKEPRSAISMVLTATSKEIFDRWLVLRSTKYVTDSGNRFYVDAYYYTIGLESQRYVYERKAYEKMHRLGQIFRLNKDNTNEQSGLRQYQSYFLMAIIGSTLLLFFIFVPSIQANDLLIKKIIWRTVLVTSIGYLYISWPHIHRTAMSFALPLGLQNYEAYFPDRTSREVGKDRVFLTEALIERAGGLVPAPDAVADETDNKTPIPPGITEIVMENDESIISAIRKDLRITRFLHTGFSFVCFSVFLIGITWICYSNYVGGDDVLIKNAEGGILSFVTGIFSFKSLSELRRSQMAVAIFETCAGELHSNLLEAAAEPTLETRERRRERAYTAFRKSMNQLWRIDFQEKQNVEKST